MAVTKEGHQFFFCNVMSTYIINTAVIFIHYYYYYFFGNA